MARILVVEDEKIMAQSMAATLKNMGHDVHCSDFSQAVDALMNEAYELVVADVFRPGDGGMDPISTILMLPDCPPFLVVSSGLAEDFWRFQEKNYPSRPMGFLGKPFTASELGEAVENALDRRRRVLVVDDEDYILEFYTLILQNLDFEVDTALSIKEAKSRLKEKSFDLVITDMMMPGGDGFELIDSVAGEEEVCPPFVVSSAWFSQEEISHLRQEYPNTIRGFLAKPATADDFRSTVLNALKPL